jgi:hypothetical protein
VEGRHGVNGSASARVIGGYESGSGRADARRTAKGAVLTLRQVANWFWR